MNKIFFLQFKSSQVEARRVGIKLSLRGDIVLLLFLLLFHFIFIIYSAIYIYTLFRTNKFTCFPSDDTFLTSSSSSISMMGIDNCSKYIYFSFR